MCPVHSVSDVSVHSGTEELVRVLEGVLRRYPNHVGANHYYVHSIEASHYPERALPSADRLGHLVPGAGHLVHMPGHIYIRVGDYEAAAEANERAIEADEAYVKLTGAHTMYAAMYYHHNIHFLTVARAEQGRVAETKAAAAKLEAGMRPIVAQMPMAEGFLAVPLAALLRVHAWDDVLAAPEPEQKMLITTAYWRFAGDGVRRKGSPRSRIAEARSLQRRGQARAGRSDVRDCKHGPACVRHCFRGSGSPAGRTGGVDRALEESGGTAGRPRIRRAAGLVYPIRESLGGALLRSGQAAGSEAVFRECLVRNPRDGRALFELIESVKAQNRTTDLEFLQSEFDSAWTGATLTLRVEEL